MYLSDADFGNSAALETFLLSYPFIQKYDCSSGKNNNVKIYIGRIILFGTKRTIAEERQKVER